MNLSCDFNYSDHNHLEETVDRKFFDCPAKLKLPRHISSLKSKAHNSADRLGRANLISEIDARNSNCGPEQAIDLAVTISQYQLKDRVSQQRHLQNIHHNLERRLQIAVAQQNHQLISILQEEFKQLQTIAVQG